MMSMDEASTPPSDSCPAPCDSLQDTEATTSNINANTTVGQEGDTSFDGTTHAAGPGSYAAAKRACIENVQAIARNCIRNNERFTDPDFDLKNDFWNPKGARNCLNGLFAPVSKDNQQNSAQWNEDEFPTSEFVDGVHKVDCRSLSAKNICIRAGAWILDLKQDPDKQDNEPKSVHRVSEIFERPIFAPGCLEVCIPASTELEQSDKTLAKLWETITQLAALVTELGLLAPIFDLWGSRGSILFLSVLIAFSFVRWIYFFRMSRPLYTSTQMAQGHLGDCWFLSAIAALGSRNDLLQKICVAWDLKLGIYGFCFYQHGAWTHIIVDDYLYLTSQDFHAANDKNDNLNCERSDLYRAGHQSGSNALHFAKCQDTSQIWLPLLEKAFAKLHGDFYALKGGMPDEGIEDLTGGVASRFDTRSISDHNRLWGQLRACDSGRVFALSSFQGGEGSGRHGIVSQHAYAIEQAVEYFDISSLSQTRLLRIRNPWGSSRRGLWHGPWARGSKEWTPFASLRLQRSADDGVFYMTFEDALKTFETLHIARVFDETWSRCQAWTELNVSWIPEYNNVYFQLVVTRATETVLSLQQLEARHYLGLQGTRVFHLDFVICRQNVRPEDYVARATSVWSQEEASSSSERSLSTEIQLEAGVYNIFVKVHSSRRHGDNVQPAKNIHSQFAHSRPRKLQQLAQNYDQARKRLTFVGKATRIIEPPAANGAARDSWGGDTPNQKSTNTSGTFFSTVEEVNWLVTCGVGLRVFSKDPDMSLSLRCQDESEQVVDELESKAGDDWEDRSDVLGQQYADDWAKAEW